MASRIVISNMHKATDKEWMLVVDKMFNHKDPKNDEPAPLISQECYDIIKENITERK